MYMRQNTSRNNFFILNSIKLCRVSDLKDVLNTFIVLHNVKYLEIAWTTYAYFLARWVYVDIVRCLHFFSHSEQDCQFSHTKESAN